MGFERSKIGWRSYVERLAALTAHPAEQQQRTFADVACGRPIGTEGWKRALARAQRHRALEQDLPRQEILPLRQARWSDTLAQVLKSRGLTRVNLAPSRRMPRWKVEVADLVRKSCGTPYRWLAEELGCENPGTLRAAVCWLGRR